MTRGRESGQATVLLVAVMFVTAALVAALVGLGAELVQRGRLQAAADLTALAAAHDRRLGADVASRNGATLVDVRRSDEHTVVVTVERGGRRAVAAADT